MIVNIDEVRIIFNSLNIKVHKITKVKTLSNFLIKVETNEGNFQLDLIDKIIRLNESR